MSIRITPLTEAGPEPSTRRLAWLASGAAGAPAGSAFLRLFPERGRRHLAELELHVHPAERRHGVGSRLLEAAVTAARLNGRRSVIAQAAAGSPGDRFLPARGFRRVLTLTFARLSLADVNEDALAEIIDGPYPGYRLEAWQGAPPEALTATFAAAHAAMDDMPLGDADHGRVTWDAARVRAAAGAVERRGDVLHTAVAVDASDGSVVGFSDLVVPGDGTGDAQHYGTGVLPGHRGHGLGRWMKAALIRRVRDRHPRLGGLLTDMADGNAQMKAINDALGYVATHRAAEYRLDLTAAAT